MAVIHIKYFASLRERVGRAEQDVDPSMAATVEELWALVAGHERLPDGVLAAVNLEYADPTTQVYDEDEVAFFPPVTGGRP